MKNLILFSFAIFSVFCTAQNKENRIESYSYILDDRREKIAIFDKDSDIIIRGDFWNDKHKIKDYLFEDGVIYHKNDSVGFYRGRKIHIYDKNFIYRKPLFKKARIYDLDTKERLFYIYIKRSLINVEYLQDIEEEPYFEILCYWAISKKVKGVSFNREMRDHIIDTVVWGTLAAILLK